MGLRIVGMGLAVPPAVETAADLAGLVAEDAAWIEQHTGVLRRHVASNNLQVADLAVEAARDALGDGEPPDLILSASATQHQLLPDTSVFLQQALGLSGVASFSIHATCMSFLVSLQVADSLLASRAYRRILICSAEIATRARDFTQPESAALLGDGAGAAVVEWDDSPAGIQQYQMNTWPEGAEWAEVRGCGHRKLPNRPDTQPEDYLFQMRGRESYKLIRTQLPNLIEQILQRAGLSLEEIDCVVPHQASGPGLRLLERIGFAPQRIVNIIADYGNCVAASIPMALAVAVRSGRIHAGDRVLILGAGAGLSVGAALLQW